MRRLRPGYLNQKTGVVHLGRRVQKRPWSKAYKDGRRKMGGEGARRVGRQGSSWVGGERSSKLSGHIQRPRLGKRWIYNN